MNHLTNLSNRAVLGILIGVALMSGIGSLVVNVTSDHSDFAEWGESWLQNFSTEMVGALFTFWLIDRVIGGREKREEEERAVLREKDRLKSELQSSVTEVAQRAAEEFSRRGWLIDGSLEKEPLTLWNAKKLQDVGWGGARLSNITLIECDLRGADLRRAKLVESYLHDVILANAKISWADFTCASLSEINMSGATLHDVNFSSASLKRVKFNGSNLTGTNLKGAILDETEFDDTTILPDGLAWTPETDVMRFTDPDHPAFWRSSNPSSHAYRDKS